MKLEILQARWYEVYGKECLCIQAQDYGGAPVKNGICVTFKPHGKTYTYRLSVYKMAEKFNLIPKRDYNKETESALKAIAAGGYYDSITSQADTLRVVYQNAGKYANVKCHEVGKDSFDRVIYRYTAEFYNSQEELDAAIWA